MGIFERIVTVVKSNINDMISKSEDPKKMLEQIILDMNEKLIQAKQKVAHSIADEKKLKKAYIEANTEASSWEKRAVLAVNKDNDGLAMEALKKQESAENTALQYQQQWRAQKDAVDKLKMALQGLNDKIQEARRKKNLLIARQKRAEAQSKISQTMASLSDSSAFDSFSRMEAKVDEIEAKAEAENELSKTLSGSSLDDKFKALEFESNTENKLANLKLENDPVINDKLASLKTKMGKDI